MGSLIIYHLKHTKKMVVEKVINILLLLNLMGINAFETEKCKHEKLISAATDLGKCLEKDSEAGDDHCTPFEEARHCVDENLKDCFVEDDVTRITKDTLAGIRNASTRILLHPAFHQSIGVVITEEMVDEMLSTCENIPDKTKAQNIEKQKIVILEDGVKTDNNCTREEVMEVNNEIMQCMKVEKENAQAKLRKVVSRKASVQSAICSIMNKTLGKCIRKPFPFCFSKREKAFLKSEIKEQMKSVFEAVEDLLGASGYGISISSCSVFSSSEIYTQPSVFVYILLMVFSLYIIL